MRVSRLLELLVRLQLHGRASAPALAAALGVSVRTIYRDVAALSAAGVPVWTETGRYGGVRIDPAYRIAGLPRLNPHEARSLLFAVVPAIAAELGLDADAAERTLLPAMEGSTERAARVVRDRLLVEPTHWFVARDPAPALAAVATAVWEARELRLSYRGSEVVAHPLGLVLKGDRWYVVARARGRGGAERRLRLFRLSRVEAVELSDQRFDRPPDFDLAGEWTRLREAFLVSIPQYTVTVRVAPEAEPLLALLDEGRPELPLPAGTDRDEHGWARLDLLMETPERAVRQLLRLGAGLEVLGPPELRRQLASEAAGLAALYAPGDGSCA